MTRPKQQIDRKYLHRQAPWTLTNDLIDCVRDIAVKRKQVASRWVAQVLEEAVKREEQNHAAL